MPELVLCVDVGSTFTKAVLVDAAEGRVLGAAQHPTTLPDVMVGIAAARESLSSEGDEVLVCSSAGGGLRLAVVGHERLVTAEAGQRVALSAGGRVVHLSSGPLAPEGVQALREARPDLIVLTGGTDGGNAEVVVHNARRLGIARLPIPVVLACNQDAAAAAADELRRRGRSVTVTSNVLPSIGTFEPGPAREAIRDAFLQHVIGGKGLSRAGSRINGRSFRQLVTAPTPDVVLTGAEVLAGGRGLLMVDVGGATTDVYSVLPREVGDERGLGAAGEWLSARTVEGDLGVRSGALGVVDAALKEGLIDADEAGRLRAYAARVAGAIGPGDSESKQAQGVAGVPNGVAGAAGEHAVDLRLAELAVLIAVRRHGRPVRPGAVPRPLRDVGHVVVGGGVLRHSHPRERANVIHRILTDHAGGWAVPQNPATAVDAGYTLFAAGLLVGRATPEAVRQIARAGLTRTG